MEEERNNCIDTKEEKDALKLLIEKDTKQRAQFLKEYDLLCKKFSMVLEIRSSLSVRRIIKKRQL